MQRRLVRAIGMMLVVGLVAVPGALAGATTGGADRQGELEEAIAGLSAEERRLAARLTELAAERDALDRSLAETAAAIAAAEVAIAEADAAVAALTAEAQELEEWMAVAERARHEARRGFDRAAAEMYMAAGPTAPALVGAAFDGRAPLEVSAATRYLEEVSHGRRAAVDRLVAIGAAIDDARTEVAHREAEARRLRAEVRTEADRLGALRSEQAAARAALADAEARERALLAEVQDRQDRYERELAALHEASRQTSGFLAARQAGQERAADFTVVRPVPGGVTSGYGTRVHPILGTTRLHAGIDFAGAQGTPVRAGAAGQVAWAAPRGGYGTTVIVDHGNQYATLYAHLSSVAVAVGERVEAGSVVGAIGSTGMSTGPHLHFEVRLLGVPRNPVDHLR